MAGIRFVAGKPALLAGRTLVVADVHVGIEHELWQSGLKVPSGTEALKKSLLSLVKRSMPRELVILGDLKHKVPGTSLQEERELPAFFAGFPVPVTVAPGNHDPGLERLAPGLRLSASPGFKKTISGLPFYFSHGHAWPAKGALSCNAIFIGHLHPCVEFRDAIGKVWVEPVWVRAGLNRARLQKRYGKLPLSLPELVIVPAFNPLARGVPLNRAKDWMQHEVEEIREPVGPLVKCAELEKADITLLDGTYLGTLKALKEKNQGKW